MLRRAAELLQALAALLPFGGAQDADVAALVEGQAGADFAPQDDVLRRAGGQLRHFPDPGGLVMACGDDALAHAVDQVISNQARLLER